MRKLFSGLVALTLFGSYIQIILYYFMDYGFMLQYGDRPEKIVAILVLAAPTIAFIAIHRFIMKGVYKLLNWAGSI